MFSGWNIVWGELILCISRKIKLNIPLIELGIQDCLGGALKHFSGVLLRKLGKGSNLTSIFQPPVEGCEGDFFTFSIMGFIKKYTPRLHSMLSMTFGLLEPSAADSFAERIDIWFYHIRIISRTSWRIDQNKELDHWVSFVFEVPLLFQPKSTYHLRS